MKIKSLKEYTNDELILFLQRNELIELNKIGAIVSEILRRMNEKKPLLPEELDSDWGIPLTP